MFDIPLRITGSFVATGRLAYKFFHPEPEKVPTAKPIIAPAQAQPKVRTKAEQIKDLYNCLEEKLGDRDKELMQTNLEELGYIDPIELRIIENPLLTHELNPQIYEAKTIERWLSTKAVSPLRQTTLTMDMLHFSAQIQDKILQVLKFHSAMNAILVFDKERLSGLVQQERLRVTYQFLCELKCAVDHIGWNVMGQNMFHMWKKPPSGISALRKLLKNLDSLNTNNGGRIYELFQQCQRQLELSRHYLGWFGKRKPETDATYHQALHEMVHLHDDNINQFARAIV